MPTGDYVSVLSHGLITSEGGAADYPPESKVLAGEVYAGGAMEGNVVLPLPAVVKLHEQYGANGTEFTGEYTGLPDPGPTGEGDDWLNWEHRENVTLRVLTNPANNDADTFTDYQLVAAGGAAKRRAIKRSEIFASGGNYTSSNIVWLIPTAVLPSGITPRPRHKIIDGDGQSYSIAEVNVNRHAQTFRCVAVLE